MKADRAELIQDPPLAGKAHFLSRRQKRKHTKQQQQRELTGTGSNSRSDWPRQHRQMFGSKQVADSLLLGHMML